MILTILLFIIGFICGYIANKETIATTVQTASSVAVKTKKLFTDPPIQPGILKRPSAAQLKLRNEPLKVREGKQAMKEALDKVPELQL